MEASFSQITHAVTPSAGAGGSISPSTAQTVAQGSTTSFTVTPNTGYQISGVGGTCGGSLSGNTYTTNAVTAACTVAATFSKPDEVVDLGTEELTLSFSGPSTCNLTSGSAKSTSVSSTPDEISSSIGTQVEFKLDSCAASESVTVQIDFGVALPDGSKVYKIIGDNWVAIDSATISGTTVTYTVTDNGPYDSNPTAGAIDDPVTVAVPVPTTPTPVPALPLAYLLMLLGTIVGLGVRELHAK